MAKRLAVHTKAFECEVQLVGRDHRGRSQLTKYRLTGLTSYTHINNLEVLDISGNEIDGLSRKSRSSAQSTCLSITCRAQWFKSTTGSVGQ